MNGILLKSTLIRLHFLLGQKKIVCTSTKCEIHTLCHRMEYRSFSLIIRFEHAEQCYNVDLNGSHFTVPLLPVLRMRCVFLLFRRFLFCFASAAFHLLFSFLSMIRLFLKIVLCLYLRSGSSHRKGTFHFSLSLSLYVFLYL